MNDAKATGREKWPSENEPEALTPAGRLSSIFAPTRLALSLMVIGLLLAGAILRLYDLTDPPLDFHPTRQLHSAMIARGMYYQSLPSASDWQRQMAVRQWKAEGVLEPPVMETLAVVGYRLVGGVEVWIPRLLSILFWLAGGLALFDLSRRLAGIDGALIGLALYLFLPYGAIASRSFQPDPLMVTLILASAWAMERWETGRTWKWALLAGMFAGAAVLIKVVAVFFVGGALVGILLAGLGIKKALSSIQAWAMGLLIVVPALIYQATWARSTGTLGGEVALRFMPSLWVDPGFYLRWLNQIKTVIGPGLLAMGLLGALLFAARPGRGLALGLWAGYFAFGMAFAHHISTHDYYSLPLIPIAALCISPLAGSALVYFRSLRPGWMVRLLAAGILVFCTGWVGWDIRTGLKRTDYRPQVAFWETLGEKLGHRSGIISLSADYSFPLAYFGWVTPTNWWTSADFAYREQAGGNFDMLTWFDQQTAGANLFVVTDFADLARQPQIKQLLYDRYAIYDQGEGYVIFDLTAKK